MHSAYNELESLFLTLNKIKQEKHRKQHLSNLHGSIFMFLAFRHSFPRSQNGHHVSFHLLQHLPQLCVFQQQLPLSAVIVTQQSLIHLTFMPGDKKDTFVLQPQFDKSPSRSSHPGLDSAAMILA